MTHYQVLGKVGWGRGRWEVSMSIEVSAGVLVLMKLLYLDFGGGHICCRNA